MPSAIPAPSDLSVYEKSAHAVATYLALTGGTLVGALLGTTATMSGAATALSFEGPAVSPVRFKSYAPKTIGNPRFIFDTDGATSYVYDPAFSIRDNGVEMAAIAIGTGLFQSFGFGGGIVAALNNFGQAQMRQTGAPTSGKAGFNNPYGATRISGSPPDGASAIGVRIATDIALTAGRIAEIANLDVVKSYFLFDGTLNLGSDLQTLQGQKITFDGTTALKYFSSDGSNLTLTGLALQSSVALKIQSALVISDVGANSVRYTSFKGDSNNVIGHEFSTNGAYANGTAKLAAFLNGTTSKAYFDLNGYLSVGATAAKFTSGSGTPESVVTAPIGSIYMRTDGGAGTSLYIKESGAGNTGWVAK